MEESDSPASPGLTMTETESLGQYLKKERERKNVSLRDVSKNTRVREHLLKALEEDRYDLLPPPTFVKGFLQSYAKYVGLDANEVLLRFQNMMTESMKEEPAPLPEKKLPPQKRRLALVAATVSASLALVFLFLYYYTFQRPAPLPVSPGPSELENQQSLSPSSPPLSPVLTEEGKPLSLRLEAAQRTWIRFHTDHELPKEVMLQPGEALALQALSRIDLLVGNAGGLDVTLNGKKLQRFGASGEVVDLVITSEGVEAKRKEKTTRSPSP